MVLTEIVLPTNFSRTLCATCLFQMGLKHAYFLSRTVFVKNNQVEAACRTLNRILAKDGILDQFRRTRYYEKPTKVRRRVNYQRCKAIYDEDMDRRIQFMMRKNRTDPYPGCL
ncbi:hypothetical protein QAD02_024414 [Eretmocerus hayati]|uniref:Uncharacterized protein n=1 Tax=Eretmocerus hayati TaxID=131215 RepID=A0ACC2PZA4_9HYME|nr:hypothetical protein QAD02_024414 [Eretmocerus hayati]